MREIPFFITERRTGNPARRAKKYRAVLVRDVESIYASKRALQNPADIYAEFSDLFRERNVDAFYFIYFDNKMQPIGMSTYPEHLLTGGTKRFTTTAQDLFTTAIMLNAARYQCIRWKTDGVVVTPMDSTVAKSRLADYSDIMGIPFDDYIVMSDMVTEHGRWFSFRLKSLLD